MALTPEQVAAQKAEDAAKRLVELEALVSQLENDKRDVTTESMSRKEKIRELEAQKQERDDKEKQAEADEEAARIKALPPQEQQAAEVGLLTKSFQDVVAGLNAKIDGLTTSVEASTRDSIDRTKQAAIESVVGTMPFHDPGDVKRQIDMAAVPMVNGEPDRSWIAQRVQEVATNKPYLLKQAATTIPAWGGTAAPTTEPGPAPLRQEMTPEQRGAALIELSEKDPAEAMMQALLGTVPLPDGATKDALGSPKL